MSHGCRVSVNLVQQGVWDTALESMPLAVAYLKAAALADDRIRAEAHIQVSNFRGGVSPLAMANQIFSCAVPPDIMGFSVNGWNYNRFGTVAETFKQLNPDGWVVFGGTHVTNQAERTFRMFPAVDVIVNGEGELTFKELLCAYLDGTSPRALGQIAGISYRDAEGLAVSTPARTPVTDLDEIPSPLLTGAIPLTDPAGNFRYDVALIETNRGCPYKCSFCYWGGAVGQRVRCFSRDRLRSELESLAKLGVHTVVACDANFGMLPADKEFVDDLIEMRDRYGYPRAFETSWAKNKSKRFFEIVHKMKKADLRSSFTLALQTLNDEALGLMNRRNMRVNEWEQLATWLTEEGLDCYAELIWGAPGETVNSFMAGYDRLAQHVSRIAVYPMLLLPNTDYVENKAVHGIISVRGDNDDFEYVLAHRTLGLAENQQMQGFIFWARVMGENAVLRHTWTALRKLTQLRQSAVLSGLAGWIAGNDDPVAVRLREMQLASSTRSGGSLGPTIGYLLTAPEAENLLLRWWQECVDPLVPEGSADVLGEILRYDLLTRPLCQPDNAVADGGFPVAMVRGHRFYVRTDVVLRYDISRILAELRSGRDAELAPEKTVIDLYYRAGAESAVASTNHELIVQFMGMTLDEAISRAGR